MLYLHHFEKSLNSTFINFQIIITLTSHSHSVSKGVEHFKVSVYTAQLLGLIKSLILYIYI